jgi:hypothetical protein
MRYSLGDIRYRFERIVSYIGGGIIVPGIPLVLALKSKQLRLPLAVTVAASIAWGAALRHWLHYSAGASIFYSLCAAGGLLLSYYCALYFLKEPHDRAKHLCMLLHLILQLAGGLFLTLYAVRYLLPVVFVFILISAVLIERSFLPKYRPIAWGTILAGSILISITLSIGDYQLADVNRKIVAELKASYPGKSVNYCGRLGYLYYMHSAGFNNLIDSEGSLMRGDIFVRNLYVSGDGEFYARLKDRLKKIREIQYPLFPLRTWGATAGFYGHNRLPFALVSYPCRFEIYEVTGNEALQ